jgi:poly-gamma-glutamate synthesis protein (capsule biosynthesis protein)
MRRNAALLIVFLMLITGISLAEFVFTEVEPVAPPTELVPNENDDNTENEQPEPIEIIISAVGDLTLGANMKRNPASTMYTQMLQRYNNDLSYFFANAREIFEADDLTIANFEGTLTNITEPPSHKMKNEFLFRVPPEHVQVLTLNSIEAVALENNHIMDFGEQGYLDTVATLTSAGVIYASDGSIGVFETNGVSIAMLAYQTFDNAYDRLFVQVPLDIEAARAEHDVVIVSYHWGREKDYAPNTNQIKLGRLTIDAGADLVLGHHSHRINPIEQYNGKYIVYSLSNSSFSGNSRPSDMDTFIFQQKFIITDGVCESSAFRIIPASMSSITAKSGKQSGENDLAFTPFPEGSAGISRVINKMKENGKNLQNAVDDYPTDWQ